MLDGFLAFFALAYLWSVASLCLRPGRARAVVAGVGAFGAGAVGACWVSTATAVVPACTALLVAAELVRRRAGLTVEGATVWASFVLTSVTSLVWGARFLLGLDLSYLSMTLLWCSAVLVAVSLPSSVVQTYEAWERMLRANWLRPRVPLHAIGAHRPFVSIHVPIHAEPPDVVIATLDRLAALRYDAFEVLVIDNNTPDSALWVPVGKYCRQLGRRFRFFHVDGLAGAKAGALNYALARTDHRADVIGVVDADYQVEPDWLARTVGYFEDDRVGFVQCPHAYRDFGRRRFGRMANAEYGVFFETSMAAYNERDAALTVGTMSLIDRRALVRAGGWATWCLTEDSELSVRLHALGHTSIYLTHPFGRGLIPDTFAAYKKQRFRWTYGPVQELRHHLGLFLPRPWRRRSRLSIGQRVHHGNHGLDVALIGVRFVGFVLGTLAAVSMVAHSEIVTVPLALWIAATAMLAASLVMRMVIFRRVLRAAWSEIVGALVAYHALGHVIRTASLRALIGLPARWQRTDKFPARPGFARALRAARTETLIGLACCVAAVAGYASFPHRGLATMLLLGVFTAGVSDLCAPLTALVADLDVRQAEDRRASVVPLHRVPPDDLLPAVAGRPEGAAAVREAARNLYR
jgi:cellulose synthase/poly-beta-1,6-N-acetylglucosamine synthase-like glycosyltransferase